MARAVSDTRLVVVKMLGGDRGGGQGVAGLTLWIKKSQLEEAPPLVSRVLELTRERTCSTRSSYLEAF